MTDRDSIRMLLLQMECGVVRYDCALRDYLATTLDLFGARSRAEGRQRRRRLLYGKLSLLLTLFWLILLEINGGRGDVSVLWPAALIAAYYLATHLPRRAKEQLCRRHYECALQRTLGVSTLFPYEWQSSVSARSLKRYSEGLEWDLEWRLKRWENRVLLVLVGGLLLCLCLVCRNLGPMYCCCWGDLG